jgi:hypothetical protein
MKIEYEQSSEDFNPKEIRNFNNTNKNKETNGIFTDGQIRRISQIKNLHNTLIKKIMTKNLSVLIKMHLQLKL